MIEPGMFLDPNYMEVDQLQVPHPELGPLERRVEKTFEEALFEDEISVEDAQYWFTEPPGGWNQEKKLLRKATVAPNLDADAKHFGEGRIKANELEEGQEMVGTINRCMLFHGAQVDIGAEYDALIPVGEDSWLREGSSGVRELQEALQLEAEVHIRIHKIVKSPICRFPIVAELLSPSLDDLLPDVRKYEPVFDLRGQRDMEVAKRLTGRSYTPTNYWLDVVPDTTTRALNAVNDELNLDDAKEPSETMSPALMARIMEMAAAR